MKENKSYYFTEKKEQSSRAYFKCPYLKQINVDYLKVRPEYKVCLIGDGQGADTFEFYDMGVKPANISSINYDQNEVVAANNRLKNIGIEMKQGDATDWGSMEETGLTENSQDIVTLLHVLEVPFMKGEKAEKLIGNIEKILKPGGRLMITQYKYRLDPERARNLGVEEITQDAAKSWFAGDDWVKKFKDTYGQEWREGMLFSEISNIRTPEQLRELFREGFEELAFLDGVDLPDNRTWLQKLGGVKRPHKDEYVMILKKLNE